MHVDAVAAAEVLYAGRAHAVPPAFAQHGGLFDIAGAAVANYVSMLEPLR